MTLPSSGKKPAVRMVDFYHVLSLTFFREQRFMTSETEVTCTYYPPWS